jgi:DNA-binding NarL/FixJ family response regulator
MAGLRLAGPVPLHDNKVEARAVVMQRGSGGEREKMRVLIADDHAIVRKGLRQIAEESGKISVDEAANGQEALDKLRQDRWDALVLDISMPGRHGLDVLQAVRDLQPQLPVLILSMHPEEQYAMRVLKAGASGYMNKDTAPGELVQAIQKIVNGGKYISATLAEKLAYEISGDSDKLPHEKLSDREYRVLVMIGAGKSVSQIAEELSLSVKTVSTYRSRLLEKMNLNNNADLIRYVIDHNLS